MQGQTPSIADWGARVKAPSDWRGALAALNWVCGVLQAGELRAPQTERNLWLRAVLGLHHPGDSPLAGPRTRIKIGAR